MVGLFLLLAFAGTLAGIVTGLASVSASAVVTPLLVGFGAKFGYEYLAYTAITVSLFTDVFSSAISAYTYKKNGNIKLKEGLILAISAVIFSIIGSYLGNLLPDSALGNLTSLMTMCIGISFLFKAKKKKEQFLDENYKEIPKTARFANHQTLASIFFGSLIGLICGLFGAGGGMMILIILTTVLGYDTKTAIGTSVLIMAFTALSGGIAHIALLEQPFPYKSIAVTAVFAILGAKGASTFANKVPEYKLLRIVGTMFVILGGVLILQKQLGM